MQNVDSSELVATRIDNGLDVVGAGHVGFKGDAHSTFSSNDVASLFGGG